MGGAHSTHADETDPDRIDGRDAEPGSPGGARRGGGGPGNAASEGGPQAGEGARFQKIPAAISERMIAHTLTSGFFLPYNGRRSEINGTLGGAPDDLDKNRGGRYSRDVPMKGQSMKNRPSAIAVLGILALALGLILAASACKKIKQASEALEYEEPEAEAESEPAEPKPAAPQPKITEPVYIEIMARTALIWEKFKDAPADAEKAVEAVYEKFNIVHAEFREYQQKLAPAKAAALQKNIQEFIQKIASEYR
jgi:hypothetical protein